MGERPLPARTVCGAGTRACTPARGALVPAGRPPEAPVPTAYVPDTHAGWRGCRRPERRARHPALVAAPERDLGAVHSVLRLFRRPVSVPGGRLGAGRWCSRCRCSGFDAQCSVLSVLAVLSGGVSRWCTRYCGAVLPRAALLCFSACNGTTGASGSGVARRVLRGCCCRGRGPARAAVARCCRANTARVGAALGSAASCCVRPVLSARPMVLPSGVRNCRQGAGPCRPEFLFAQDPDRPANGRRRGPCCPAAAVPERLLFRPSPGLPAGARPRGPAPLPTRASAAPRRRSARP